MSWFILLKQEFIFFNSIPAKNTSVWVKFTFCISANMSYTYTIDTRVFTPPIWFFWWATTLLHRLSTYFPLSQRFLFIYLFIYLFIFWDFLNHELYSCQHHELYVSSFIKQKKNSYMHCIFYIYFIDFKHIF